MSGAFTLYTSSTRMEVEALNQALSWLAEETPTAETVLFASDSQAMLKKLQGGWFPESWNKAHHYLSNKKVRFIYVPGHSDVKLNEAADRLAGASDPTSRTSLYLQDIALLASRKAKQNVLNNITSYDEGSHQ